MRLVRRYRSIMVCALPLGAVFGALLYLMMFASIGWALPGALSYAACGVLVAASAVLGSLIAGIACDSTLRMKAIPRAILAGLGAGSGVFALGVIVTIVDYLTTVRPSSGGFLIVIGLMLALPAAVTGALMVAAVDARESRRSGTSRSPQSWEELNGL